MISTTILLFIEPVRSVIGRAAFVVLLLGLFSSSLSAADKVYEGPKAFLERNFGAVPKTRAISLSGTQQKQLKSLIGRNKLPKKIRYWKSGEKIAWILEREGKSELITTGFIVKDGKIREMKVLIYRESHGWEVSRPFFTKQFTGMSLDGKKLSSNVDGIVGATLSVNALKKLAAAALYLSQQIEM